MKKHLNSVMLVISLALFSLPAIAMEPSDTPEQQLQKTVKQAADKQGSQGFWNKLDKSPRMLETMRRVVQQYLNPQGSNPLVSTFAKKLIEIAASTLSGHKDNGLIKSLVFSSDGTKLAAGSSDQTIKIWDIANPHNAPLSLFGHKSLVNLIKFNGDGTKLASGEVNGVIKIWDLANPKNQPVTIETGMVKLALLLFDENGTRIGAGSDQTIKIWDTSNLGVPPETYTGYQMLMNAVAFREGKLACGSSDGTIKMWDLVNDNQLPTLTGHNGRIYSLIFNSDGTKLASGSDNMIKIWDVINPTTLPLLLTHPGTILSLEFSPDGTKLVSGSNDKTIKIWSLASLHKPLLTLSGDLGFIYSLAFSPDGSRLASGDSRNKIKIWNIRGIAQLPEFIKSLYADEKGLKKFLLLRAILESNATTTDSEGKAKNGKPLDLYNPAAIAVLKDLPIWLQKALQDKNMVRVFKKKG